MFGNTWDQRRSKSELAERFPHLDFEKGFAEQDPLKEISELDIIQLDRSRAQGSQGSYMRGKSLTERDANWNEGNADRLQQVSDMMTNLVKTCPETCAYQASQI